MSINAAKCKVPTKAPAKVTTTKPKARKSFPPTGSQTRRVTKPNSSAANAAEVIVEPISKQSRLIALMRTPGGGSLESLMAATGWQAHSVRGVISGVLRKKMGLAVSLVTNSAGQRAYQIAS